jgi:aminoglycoside phosphotransferase (APT) family kinase protein
MTTERTPIDAHTVLRALGVTAESAAALPGGWDTTIWRVERASGPAVLRLLRYDEAARCEREALAMDAVAAAGVPAPRVLARGRWEGRPALLLSWLPGSPLAQVLRSDPTRAVPLGDAFGRTLARLHAVSPPDVLARISDDWVAVVGEDETALQARLRALSGEASALLHLDYHPMNTLAEGDAITGVVDWANVRVGDPRADLARTLVLLSLAARVFSDSGVRRAGRHLFRVACLRGYRAAGGETADLAAFLAWGWLVTARDLAPNLGRPGHWLRAEHLEFMRRRGAAWKRRAGLPKSE